MFALLEAAGESQVVAVGTSMGGLMAMVMNAAKPGVFTHVVLNDIGPELSKVGLDRISSYVGQGGPISTWEGGSVQPQYQWCCFSYPER